MPSLPVGDTLRSSARSYAVFMFSQSPHVSSTRIPGLILQRYPELTLGEADRIVADAQAMVSAGVVFAALPPDEPIRQNDVPVDPDVPDGYRSQVVVRVPGPDGEPAARTVIIDTPNPPSRSDIAYEVLDIMADIVNYPDWMRRIGGIPQSPQDVGIDIISVGRSPNT